MRAMGCFKLVDGKWGTVDGPVAESDNFDEALDKAGYVKQLSSQTVNHVGGEISVYQTEARDKPEFFIDIMGGSHQIAHVVATDFAHLVTTLKEIAPLIALMGLEQQADIQATALVDQEAERRKKHGS